MLRKILRSPYLALFSGVILLFTSGYDVWQNFADTNIGTRHGILLFGIMQILKSLPDILDGIAALDGAEHSI